MTQSKALLAMMLFVIAYVPVLAQLEKDELQQPTGYRPANRLQFNITRTKHLLPVSPTTAAIMALIQAIVMSAIVIVGLFCGPGMQPPKPTNPAVQRRVKMERSV
jgi:hypothetical protein